MEELENIKNYQDLAIAIVKGLADDYRKALIHWRKYPTEKNKNNALLLEKELLSEYMTVLTFGKQQAIVDGIKKEVEKMK